MKDLTGKHVDADEFSKVILEGVAEKLAEKIINEEDKKRWNKLSGFFRKEIVDMANGMNLNYNYYVIGKSYDELDEMFKMILTGLLDGLFEWYSSNPRKKMEIVKLFGGQCIKLKQLGDMTLFELMKKVREDPISKAKAEKISAEFMSDFLGNVAV